MSEAKARAGIGALNTEELVVILVNKLAGKLDAVAKTKLTVIVQSASHQHLFELLAHLAVASVHAGTPYDRVLQNVAAAYGGGPDVVNALAARMGAAAEKA